MSKEDKIIILDFGSQYTQLIARRVREIGVFSVILPSDVSIEKIQSFNPNGIIIWWAGNSYRERYSKNQ